MIFLNPFLLILILILILDFFFWIIKISLLSFLSSKKSIKKKNELINPIEEKIIEKNSELKLLESNLITMSIEAEKLNNPTHFALHSKMQRKINTVKSQIDTKNEELQELIKERNKEQNKTPEKDINNELIKKGLDIFLKLIPNIIIFIIMKNNKYQLNANLSGIYPLSFFLGTQIDDAFEIEFTIIWIVICQRVKNRLFECLNKNK